MNNTDIPCADTVQKITAYLAEHEQEMITLLKQLAGINSYTGNKSGVDAVATRIQQECERMGLTVRRQVQAEVGDNLVIETAARTRGVKGMLLCGHMDTVFPEELGFNTVRQEGNVIYGPGVADMKSGLVAGIFIFKAFKAAGVLNSKSIAFICNSDEETGSAMSAALIAEEAGKSRAAFVLEGAGDNGELVIGRKGRVSFRLVVTGQAGHAGSVREHKASAVLELARQVQALEALNDPSAGTSVNVGRIEGGVGPNTVAEHAVATAECRFMTSEAGDAAWEAITQLAAAPQTTGTTSVVERISFRPPMTTNEQIHMLYSRVEAVGKAMNIPVRSMHRGGGSDANIIAQAGIPVVDGLGPIGGKLHSTDEYLLADSIVERTTLAAVALHTLYEEYCR